MQQAALTGGGDQPGVSGSILDGLDEILNVIRLGLPHELVRLFGAADQPSGIHFEISDDRLNASKLIDGTFPEVHGEEVVEI